MPEPLTCSSPREGEEIHTPITPPSGSESPPAYKRHKSDFMSSTNIHSNPLEPAQNACYISQLPNELLTEILKYSVSSVNMYDVLVATEDMDPQSPQFNNSQRLDYDGSIAFRLTRRELCLSRVCSLWRELINLGFIDLWGMEDETLYITGEQWFHPMFPSDYLLESGAFMHTHLFLHFRNFETPVRKKEPDPMELYAPLLEPPIGANYHDVHLPVHHTTLNQTFKHVHILASEGSNISIDAVLGTVHFEVPSPGRPLPRRVSGIQIEERRESCRIIFQHQLEERKHLSFTTKSGSRMFLASNVSNGIAGGISSTHPVDLSFVVESWRDGFGWEVPGVVAELAKWVSAVSGYGLSNLCQLHVRLPEDEVELGKVVEGWVQPLQRSGDDWVGSGSEGVGTAISDGQGEDGDEGGVEAEDAHSPLSPPPALAQAGGGTGMLAIATEAVLWPTPRSNMSLEASTLILESFMGPNGANGVNTLWRSFLMTLLCLGVQATVVVLPLARDEYIRRYGEPIPLSKFSDPVWGMESGGGGGGGAMELWRRKRGGGYLWGHPRREVPQREVVERCCSWMGRPVKGVDGEELEGSGERGEGYNNELWQEVWGCLVE